MIIKIWLTLAFLCFVLTGCSNHSEEEVLPQKQDMISVEESESSAQNEISTPAPISTPNPGTADSFYESPDILVTPVREYGDSTAYIQMEEDLVVRILYPESEMPDLNKAITDWVHHTISLYQEESKNCHINGDCGELTAEYESYSLNDHFASIIIRGIFDKPYLAHPIDIVATFHVDTQTGQLLSLEDVLVPDGKSMLEQLVIDQAGVDPAFADEHLLDNWLLTHKGLEIILGRGDYLPMSEGTVTLFYPYEALTGLLNPTILSQTSETTGTTPPENADSPIAEIPEPSPELQDTPYTPPPAPEILPALPIDPDRPMVALTFDDGPGKHTERLLDIFATYGGKGTFFVIGNILDSRPEVLQRMANEGHEIGGHSWDHRQLTKLSSSDLRNQLISTNDKILEITGKETNLLRPPYGSFNKDVKNACVELDIVMANWSLDTLDWKHKDADKVYETIMQEVKDGDIILCHDLHGTTVDAMERVIPRLLQEGYQLVTVSELLDQRGEEIQAGEVYYRK